MGRFPIAVLVAFVPVWAYEKCGMDVPEVGIRHQLWLHPTVDGSEIRRSPVEFLP